MKQVLVVAHDYPPSNVVGGVRPSKFVHYLPGFGWEPIVLAGRDEHPDIPGNSTAEIYHVRQWLHPLKTYYRFLERRKTLAVSPRKPAITFSSAMGRLPVQRTSSEVLSAASWTR